MTTKMVYYHGHKLIQRLKLLRWYRYAITMRPPMAADYNLLHSRIQSLQTRFSISTRKRTIVSGEAHSTKILYRSEKRFTMCRYANFSRPKNTSIIRWPRVHCCWSSCLEQFNTKCLFSKVHANIFRQLLKTYLFQNAKFQHFIHVCCNLCNFLGVFVAFYIALNLSFLHYIILHYITCVTVW